MTDISLQEYWDQLDRHDWFYDYSDDHSVWKRGASNESKLQVIGAQSAEHRKMFEDFRDHHFSGKSFGTEKKPKPERPS